MLQAGSAAHPVIRHVIHAATLLVVTRRAFAVHNAAGISFHEGLLTPLDMYTRHSTIHNANWRAIGRAQTSSTPH